MRKQQMGAAENHGFHRSAAFTMAGGVPILDVRPIRAISPFGTAPQPDCVPEHHRPFGYAPPQPEFFRASSDYPVFDEADVRRKLEQDIALTANRRQKPPAAQDFSGDGRDSAASERVPVKFEETELRKSSNDSSLKAEPESNAQRAVPKAENLNLGEIRSHGAERPSPGGRPPCIPEPNAERSNETRSMDLHKLNMLQQNPEDVRLAFARSLRNYKDLEVLQPGSTSGICSNTAPEDIQTAAKKRKRSSKGTAVYRATNEDRATAGDDRKLVRRTRMIYNALRRSFSREGDESPSSTKGTRRPDLKAAVLMDEKGLWINRDRRIIGPVPGVRVGDQFYYRMELCVIGLHGQTQAGIDYITAKANEQNEPQAISIIASGGYEDEDGGEVLIYTGQGGNNYKQAKKQTENQKLERGNLALARSMQLKEDVRVTRGIKDSSSPSGIIYVYDGIYRVEESWLHKGRYGSDLFKFKLRRAPEQPELGSVVLKSASSWRSEPSSRPGILQQDISLGAEKLPVCLVNHIDSNRGPAQFQYIVKPMYFNSVAKPEVLQGCDCVVGCSSGCSCALRNGGELPYDHDGILITGKPLIYECGDWCRCPPTCRNRASQNGLKHRLEVFRTRAGGWGVRSWDSIPCGGFVCEYIGEVFPEVRRDAERRPEDCEFLLEAMNFRDTWREWDGVSDILHEQRLIRAEGAPCGGPPLLGFTIDAARMGNVARFMNHYCLPNVAVQFVFHDVGFPHAMLFALENIPPLTELTIDYGRCGPGQSRACVCGASGGMSRV